MAPECKGNDGDGSDEVCTVTPMEPGVATPIVKPLIVTAKAVVIKAPVVVRTTAVSLVFEHVILNPGTLLAPATTKGMTEGAKKLKG
jgi:hypothetical protein